MRRSPRVLLVWIGRARRRADDRTRRRRRPRDAAPPRRVARPVHSVVVATRDLDLGQTVAARRRAHGDALRERDPARRAHRRRGARSGGSSWCRCSATRSCSRTTSRRPTAPGSTRVVPVGDRAVHVAPKDGFRPPHGAVVDVLAAFDPTAVTVDGAGDAAVVVASGARVLAVDSGASRRRRRRRRARASPCSSPTPKRG